ncbi:39S ribosomal protein L17, mitochondrial [Amphibalanus amphitrite]|uniref:39S ribosomal protein L17, mitochondrial n=1 Tax=Amphibalanus amphitrite TaxID=1232801 RepID=A0A6A4X8S7_AMPAM|nr:39S ribosomal protein L17, mitochondrial [Amphibalanus amphitrite]
MSTRSERRATSKAETRSEAECSATSSASRINELRIKTELARLKVAQVERAATAQAAAQVQAARDEAELNELELRLEEEALEHDGESRAPSQFQSALLRQGASAVAPSPPSDVTRERTLGWIEQLSDRPRSDDRPARHHTDSALPKLKLDQFSGSPLEWPRWSSLFRALVHNHRGLTDTERLAHLQSCLTGEAREAVSGLLCDADMYTEALSELERQFGNPGHVVRAAMNRLLTVPPTKDNDLSSLRSLSTALHSAVMVLSSLSYDADLAATANLQQVVAKLPRALSWRWGEHAMTLRPAAPTLVDLDRWLRRHVDAGRLVAAEEDVSPTKHGKPVSAPATRPRRNVLTVTAKSARQQAAQPTNPCEQCSGPHTVVKCPQFATNSTDKRAELVRDKGLCWVCLQRGHRARDCPDRTPCDAVPDCKARHHSLLHGAPRLFKPRPATTPAYDADKNYVGATNGQTSTSVLLQILPVIVRGPGGERIVNALLDLGSQVSLMTEQLAADLGLSGPDEPLCAAMTSQLGRLIPQLRIPVQPKYRPLRNVEGSYGRLKNLRSTVTALVRDERVEMQYIRLDEARGYAERVLAPRYAEHRSSFTSLYKLPPAYRENDKGAPRGVLELKGNPFPPLRDGSTDRKHLLHNVLLDEARRHYRHKKYQQLAAEARAALANSSAEPPRRPSGD